MQENKNENTQEDAGDILSQRRRKNKEMKAAGINLYPNDFKVSHGINAVRQEIEGAPDRMGPDGPVFSVAGRMMAINRFGKSAFIRIKDGSGELIQAYLQSKMLGEAFDLFKQMDVGDFVGVTGTLFTTRTGEWTLDASTFRLLSKATRPLPEKYHGLKDPEKRYRKRYVDLIMNPEVREIFLRRSRMIQAVREFFITRGFLEVETPMMQVVAGGAEATPFVTHHNALGMDLFLRIAPELYLKRLVVGGFDKVFEINRNFRNEGVSTRHNPEFTMMEFYWAYATDADLMALSEELFAHVAKAVTGDVVVNYQGHAIRFDGIWPKIPLLDALVEIGGVDKKLLDDREGLLAFAKEKNISVTKTEKLGKVLTKLFDVLVEPKLIQPTFITGYPVEVSPLSRRSDKNPMLTERFELFVAGREIGNGFSELNDPEDQRQRFLMQVQEREAGDAEAHMMDEDYIEALEYGMPPTAGQGIGMDRLAMLLTDAASIREVILFPHMKPVSHQ
ncbi:lysyl-tRNA synthetase class II [Desulfobotulus alkaliphilus]|uniref:Lysine--tRNA ligase n=1 Tax=Desulfobotulus alkaliphilus TaxID=622671 RepID=A0A562RGH0_9BACT|nr:lysine--tRNA ligase [Desulfobotulus alkaliphilus]TWI68155.1 lysyl-tRNA synthetase class II [Desulfobotulus alkaliphilus]